MLGKDDKTAAEICNRFFCKKKVVPLGAVFWIKSAAHKLPGFFKIATNLHGMAHGEIY
jgi:hypothetical protein